MRNWKKEVLNKMVNKAKLFIDTDVGTDCDDLFALTYALTNPSIDIRGISTVLGDPVIRAKVVRKLERILKIKVPVISGEKGPEKSVKQFWTGLESKVLTKKELEEDFESDGFLGYDSDTRLVCIGPLTNIARQLKMDSSIYNVKEIYIMGSHPSSHNIIADADSAKVVLDHSWKKYFITKETSEKLSLSRDELIDLRGSPLGDLLCDSALNWLDFKKKERAILYDVLAVSAAAEEGYVKFKEQEGRFISYDLSSELKQNLIRAIKWQ
jgi:purine nucleosidase